MEDFDVDPSKTNPRNRRATSKQIDFMESILQQYPSVQRPTDLSRRGLSTWLDTYATALGDARLADDTTQYSEDWPLDTPMEPSLGDFWDDSLDYLAIPLDV